MLKIIKSKNREEWANTITHGVAMIFSYFGLFLLTFKTLRSGDFLQFSSSFVFGFTMVFLFTASTFYHVVRKSKWKKMLQVIDHIAIYLFIAGTYTPITLLILRDFDGVNVFYFVWAISFIGVIYKLMATKKSSMFSTIFYLILGWTILIKMDVLIFNLPIEILTWLIAGGAFYTVGVIFFLWEKLKFSHAIWHVFVVAGSWCHFYLIYNYALH